MPIKDKGNQVENPKLKTQNSKQSPLPSNPKPSTQNLKPFKILLTGATGFLGSHLLEALILNGYPTVILKRSFSNTWRIDHLVSDVKSYDIDKVPVERAFEKNNIATVIHTATHYGRNQDTVSRVVETNLLFPLKLLETAVLFNTDTFFNTDTLLYNYLNIYSLSKKQFTEWLKHFSESGKIQGVNLKIEHMYGPKDDETKFVTWLLRRMLREVKAIPLTEGKQKRDFVYVSDVVDAFLLLLEKSKEFPSFSEFDIGTGKTTSIKNFVLNLRQRIVDALGREIGTTLNFGALPYRSGEFMEIKANINGLIKMGWEPQFMVESGIKKLVRDELRHTQ